METDPPKQYSYDYPRPAVTTDCVIFGFDGSNLNVLLVERGVDPFKGQWALPGGFLRMDEAAQEGARRELQEETGLSDAYLEQLHAFSDPGRDPRGRVITIAYYALVRQREVHGGDDAADARWFPLDELPPLAFDHSRILASARNALRERMHFKPVGFNLLPESFTARELQTLYEAVLGVEFDRRNFLKKMLHYNIISPDDGDDDLCCECALPEPTGPTRRRETIRYRFNDDNYKQMKRKGFKIEF